MSTYVMSDLHGAYDALLQMLRQINFTEADTLYILGDVVDRGPDGVKILRFVMSRPNVRMLLGNHEYMCLRYFCPDATLHEQRHWNRNGNYTTLNGFDAVSEGEREEILRFLRSLPDEFRLEIGGRKYILVHGYLGEDTYHRVWSRPKLADIPEIGEDTVLIIGHTPVCEYLCPGDEGGYVLSHSLTEAGDHFRILHAPGFIDIDCCVGYGMSAARLACMRLEDGREFYEKVSL